MNTILHWLQQDGAGLFWAVVIFALMIFIHEFGHFCVAKFTGVTVLEFSLGFGPRLFGKKIGDTEYAVRILPLGGYVKMLGEMVDDGDPNDPGNFQNKKPTQKAAIVAAGPIMNYVLAIFLLIFLGLFWGITTYTVKIEKVIPGKPADKAGLKAGDEILAINGKKISNIYTPMDAINEVVHQIEVSSNIPLDLQINRNGEILNITAIPKYDEKKKVALLGFYPGFQAAFKKTNPVDAMVDAFRVTWYFTKAPFIQIGKILQGEQKASELAKGSAGPVGIADIIVTLYNEHKKNGDVFAYLIWIAAVLNIFIGLFNLFPIPALDGSRIFFMGLGAVFGKPLNPKLEENIHLAGFALLLILMVLVTYQDIWRIFTHHGF
jgi:regulator of sigma E protease